MAGAAVVTDRSERKPIDEMGGFPMTSAAAVMVPSIDTSTGPLVPPPAQFQTAFNTA